MKFKELQKQLEIIKNKGFIKSLRKGSTAIGHLLEYELKINETNLSIPDVGGRIELKATRKNSSSLITLFTFNRSVWKINLSDIIKKYGNYDNDRFSLYNSVSYKKENSQGFYIDIDYDKNIIYLKNINEKNIIAEWSIFVILGKFMTKLDRLLFVFADSKYENNTEYFHFNQAYLLEEPSHQKFLSAFSNQKAIIDLRMHLKPEGKLRNHGTAFRIFEKDLIELYNKRKKII